MDEGQVKVVQELVYYLETVDKECVVLCPNIEWELRHYFLDGVVTSCRVGGLVTKASSFEMLKLIMESEHITLQVKQSMIDNFIKLRLLDKVTTPTYTMVG